MLPAIVNWPRDGSNSSAEASAVASPAPSPPVINTRPSASTVATQPARGTFRFPVRTVWALAAAARSAVSQASFRNICNSCASFRADDPLLIDLARQLADESRGLHQHVHAAAIAGHHGENEIQLLFRARHGDVEQSALFFLAGNDDLFFQRVAQHHGHLLGHLLIGNANDSAGNAQRPLRWKAAIGEPDDEDGPPLEALGLMHGRQNDF